MTVVFTHYAKGVIYPMSQVTREASTVEDEPDFDMPLEPDASDAEEVMNFERVIAMPL